MLRVDSSDGLCSPYHERDQELFSQFSDNSSLGSSFLDHAHTSLPYETGSLESLDVIVKQSDKTFMAYKNTSALCDDLRFITGMPEMCDVTFLVSEDKVPVYGVKAILATRSRVFYEMILSQQKSSAPIHKENLKKENGWFSKLRRSFRKRRAPKLIGSLSFHHLTFDIEDFDPDTFRRMILYLHCGSTTVSVHTVVGVMNAADIYGLEDLRSACFQFARRCINMKTILPLLSSTKHFSRFKLTKLLMLEILEFIREKAQGILRLPEFVNLSKDSAMLILTTPDLNATEETKWDAAYQWSRRHCGDDHREYLKITMATFTPAINFRDIPLFKLRHEIRPLAVIPDDVMNGAILHQACTWFVIGRESKRFVIGREQKQRSLQKPMKRNVIKSLGKSGSLGKCDTRPSLSSSSSFSGSFRDGHAYDSGYISALEESSVL